MPGDVWHVCSLIVQFEPKRKDDVSAALLKIPETEIVGLNVQECKFVVLIESTDEISLPERIESIQFIEGVLAVSLVYHQQDEQPEDFI